VEKKMGVDEEEEKGGDRELIPPFPPFSSFLVLLVCPAPFMSEV